MSYLGCCGGVPEFQVRKKLLAQIRRLIPRNRKMKTGTVNIVEVSMSVFVKFFKSYEFQAESKNCGSFRLKPGREFGFL